MLLFLKTSCFPCNLLYWGDSDPWVKMFAFSANFHPQPQFGRIRHDCCGPRWVFCCMMPHTQIFPHRIFLPTLFCVWTNHWQQADNKPTHVGGAWCTKLSLCQNGLWHVYPYLSLSSIYSPNVEIYISLCPNSALVLKLLIFRVWKVCDGKIWHVPVLEPNLAPFCIFILIFFKQITLFKLNCPDMLCAVLLCVLAAGLNKQLCDGGDQEEDAGDEGGEGQPDGPLWQLWAGC